MLPSVNKALTVLCRSDILQQPIIFPSIFCCMYHNSCEMSPTEDKQTVSLWCWQKTTFISWCLWHVIICDSWNRRAKVCAGNAKSVWWCGSVYWPQIRWNDLRSCSSLLQPRYDISPFKNSHFISVTSYRTL